MYRLLNSRWSRLALALIVVVAFSLQSASAPVADAQAYNFHVYLPFVSRVAPQQTPVYRYQIVKTYTHDTSAYTEGLFYDTASGYLFESTGAQYQQSDVRKEALTASGQLQVLQSTPVPSQHYGEGIAPSGSTIFQLTWTSHVFYKFDKTTLTLTGPFSYTPATQGWGLTQDGSRFIMSDGTSTIYFRDLNTFDVIGSIGVTDRGSPVTQINELEYINGQIWANIWLTDQVAIISPQDGHIIAWVNLTGLRAMQGSAVMNNQDAVLNGIAWDPSGGGHLYVTGKLWPHLYEIQVVP